MMRGAVIGLAALMSLGACQTTTTYRYPEAPRAAPSGAFAGAPQSGPVLSELFLCHRNVANAPALGARGEVAPYNPYIFTRAGALLRNPTAGACLSSGYGPRGGGESGGDARWHAGADLANPHGGFIFAAANGRIASIGAHGGYGNVVEIAHGRGVSTFYAHLAEIDPRLMIGDFVAAGMPIARMGATGNATGVHLHYEVRIDGAPVDPLRHGLEPPVS